MDLSALNFWAVLTISDGEDTAYAYLELILDEEAGVATIDVPMAYYAPNDVDGETYQDVLLELTLDIETTELISEIYYAYNEDLGTYGELTAKPRGIIVPEVLVYDADDNASWEPTTDIGLYADLPNLQYDLEQLESGTELWLDLTVVDFGGNSDTVSAVVTVP